MKKSELENHIDQLVAIKLEFQKEYDRLGDKNLVNLKQAEIETLTEIKYLLIGINSLD